METQPVINDRVENITSECNKLATLLPELIAAKAKQYKDIHTKMETLKNAGLTYAKPHWREKKYLYLVYPSAGGDRRREYVGNDEQKIKAAHDAIARAQEYDNLFVQLELVEKRILEGWRYLKDTITTLQN